MKCPYTECISVSDCFIIEITKKIPKSKDSCSYFKKEGSQKVPPVSSRRRTRNAR